MGFYIQCSSDHHKADQLVRMHNAQIISRPPSSLSTVPSDKGVVCVVENGFFDAAAYVYSESELIAFNNRSDPRIKTWLLMDKDLAETLSGYKKK